MRVLIAYEGSEVALEGLRGLQFAGLSAGTEAVVLTVAERWLPLAQADPGVTLERLPGYEIGLARAEQGAARLRELFPDWIVTAEAAAGSPVAQVVDRARKWKADLVSVGAVGQSMLGRVLMGSVTAQVANEAPCSVRINRPRSARRPGPVRIVVGYDGMPGADSAVRAVAARSWPQGTEVKLVTAVGFGFSDVSEMNLAEDYGRAREMQAVPLATLRAAGLEALGMVVEADPKVALVEHAHELDADAIFVGHNDHRLAYRLFLGTVTSAVAARAECAVEIVRSRGARS
jgi:nucleotide-binding universal stress UspA family protein